MCLHVLVEGRHDGAGVVGVLQSQRVAQLVHSHQEEVIPCGEGGWGGAQGTHLGINQFIASANTEQSFVSGPVLDTGIYQRNPTQSCLLELSI